MPIATKCPGCKSLFRLADALAGKKVRCQKCAQLFAVPLPKAAAPAEAPAAAPPVPPPAPAPAPPPAPILMSLDEPPFVTAAPPAGDDIIDAILVEPPQPAVVAAAPKPEEIIDATVAEEEEEAPTKRRGPPKPPGAAPRARPRRAADLPRQSNLGSVALASGAFALIGLVIVACFAGVWAVISMDNGKKVAVLPPPPPFERNKDFNKKDGFAPPDLSQPLPLDGNGKAMVAGGIPPGGDAVYRVFLQQNQRYNILVSGVVPRVRIQDGPQIIAARDDGGNRALLSFLPLRTAEHSIHISRADGQLDAANFTLDFTRADPTPPMQIDLAGDPNFQTERTLRLEDPVSEEFAYGPSHKFLLNVKPGDKYQVKVKPIDFQPILRLQNGGLLIRQLMGNALNDIDFTYIAPPGVSVISVTVVSQGNAFGRYSLQITRLSEEDKAGPRTVAFALGDLYRRNETLTVQDRRDDEFGHVKEYLIPMEKGFGYNIDMKSKQIDAHLALLDPHGDLVARDDNSGGDANARMLFDPKASGQYRLIASDVKKGTGAFSIDIARVNLPASTAVNQPLATLKREEAGCDVVEASILRNSTGQFTFAWAPDGKAFFLFDREGWLRRIRYPEFVEDQRLFVAMEPAQIHRTSEGLLVSTVASRELWLFDPQSLQLKRRLPRVGGTAVLAAPALPYVFVAAAFTRPDGGQAPGVMRHDLTKGQMTSFAFTKLPLTTQFLALTPDGRYMIGRKDDRMMRWRVEDKQMVGEEAGTRYFRSWVNQNAPLVIGADGTLLLHPINNKAVPPDDIKPGPPSDFGVAAYRVKDLSKPAFILDTGIPYSAAAIDPKSGLVCAYVKNNGFVLADSQGKTVRELAINARQSKKNLLVTRMEFHPDGGKLLAFFGNLAAPKVLSIELPKDLAAPNEEKK